MGLTVAVTGPTGEIGISAVTALDRDPVVDRIIGMARRPFLTRESPRSPLGSAPMMPASSREPTRIAAPRRVSSS